MSPEQRINQLEKDIAGLKQQIEKQNDVFDKNAQVVRTLALVSNLIYKKLNITEKEVADELTKELQSYLQRSSKVDPSKPIVADDSGIRQQPVSDLPNNGTLARVPDGSEKVPEESST